MEEENHSRTNKDSPRASDFDKMAITREFETKKITNEIVWIKNIESIMELDIDFETMAQMIVGSVPDTKLVFDQLSKHHEEGKLTEEELNQIFEACVEEYEANGVQLEF
ncbi:MAG: hypothetical protein ACXAD7_05370 [Candidatus Kariarchaeaceae archaeon]|jgi:hypothetical protein